MYEILVQVISLVTNFVPYTTAMVRNGRSGRSVDRINGIHASFRPSAVVLYRPSRPWKGSLHD